MEELFKTLPQHTCSWMKDKVTFFKYQGFWNSREAHEAIISLGDQSYKADPSDVVLCSYPKSGTTWLKALTYAIVTREKFDASASPLLTVMPHNCVPSLETDHHKTPDLPIIATHLPYACLPESIIASNCKIVYIYRNIKDVIVSYYHFSRQLVNLRVEDAPFEGAFDDFSQGISAFGPYWDHILGYWKASRESSERFLFLKYEDMKVDATSNVKRLAEFIGYPFSVEEEKSGVVENIINLCSFQNLKNLQVNKNGIQWSNESVTIENKFYFRKSKDGEWEKYFTDEMKEIIDTLIDQKLTGTGLVLK